MTQITEPQAGPRKLQIPSRLVAPLIGLGFVLLAVCVYSRTLSVPLSSDAQFLTYTNEYNRSVAGLARVWTSDYFGGSITHGVPAVSGYYRPITNTFFWIAYHLAGRHSFIYNLIEVVLHGLNGFLVFLVCLRLSRNRIAAAVAGLFFVLHPVHAMAAVEPAAGADVLFPIFYFAAMLAFDSALLSRDLKSAAWKIGLTAVLYLLTLLSKEMGVTLPGVLVLLTAYRHFTDGVSWRRLGWTIPAWLAFGAYLILRFVIVNVPTQIVGYHDVYPPMVLTIGAIKGILIHFARLILPLGGTYPELNPWLVNFVKQPLTDPLAYVAVTVVLAMAIIALMYRWNAYIAFWSGFFLAAYSPLMRVDSIAGSLGHNILLTEERWIYLPSVAVAAVIGYGVARLAAAVKKRWPRPAARYALAAAVLAVLAVFGYTARLHADRHEDPLARLKQLYLLPDAELHRMQRANKAMLYAEWVATPMGDLEEAERRMREAYAEVPDSPITAGALAVTLSRRGKWREVIKVLEPWLYVTPEFLEQKKRTNFRVADDYNRVSTMIPIVLSRAYAHLGLGRAAAGLACEALLREYDQHEIADALRENWALNGPDHCSAANDPDACIARVAVPPDVGWTPPLDMAQCPTWPSEWDKLVNVGN